MALLEVRNVTMKFGSLLANNDVSFDVGEGQIVGLIGPNGSGKTTMFNCIAGLYKPTSGSIKFQGNETSGLPPYKIAQAGLARTFQIVRPLVEMTILENVMVGAYLRHKDVDGAREVALRCLDLCYLTDLKDKLAGAMTIGIKKRLEVARALATEPKILLLDEAVAGLTATEVKEMVDAILRFRAAGITILMVEHIMEAIMPIADRIVVLNGGIKIADDIPSVVTQQEKVITAYLGEKFSKRIAERRARDAQNGQNNGKGGGAA